MCGKHSRPITLVKGIITFIPSTICEGVMAFSMHVIVKKLPLVFPTICPMERHGATTGQRCTRHSTWRMMIMSSVAPRHGHAHLRPGRSNAPPRWCASRTCCVKCCGQSSKRSSRGCRRGSRNCHATGEAIVKGKGVTSRDVTEVANPVDEV